MRNGLGRLLALNRGKGFVRAEAAADGNTLYLYDVIAGSDEEAEWWGGIGPGQFARTLAQLGDADVVLRVNSPGGSVFGGRAIAAALSGHRGKVTVIVDGLAASAASFLVQAADRVEMGDGSMMMIHKAWTFALGNADAMRAEAQILDKIDGTIAGTYASAAERRGVEGVDFQQLMAAETWLTAEEAVATGLADALVETPAKANASIRWDLSAYARPPLADETGEEAPGGAQPPEPQLEPEPAPDPAAAEDAAELMVSNEIARRRRMARAIALQAA